MVKNLQHMTKAELIARVRELERNADAGALRRAKEDLRIYQDQAHAQSEHLIETQRELADALGRVTDIYHTAPVAFATLDRNGVIEEMNQTGLSLLHMERKQVVGRPLLVFIGTFGLVNGMGYLVRLAAAIAPLDAEIRIAAVGTGREYDNTRKLAEQLQVLNRNFFLLGKLPKRQAAAWMQAADMSIALFTGPEIVWRDAVQNKFFDSLAAGKPVANNFPGWQAKIAVEAGAGLILSADDIDAAARAVVGALRDRTWMEQARKAARQLAEQRYNRDLLAAQLAQLLEETVGQRR